MSVLGDNNNIVHLGHGRAFDVEAAIPLPRERRSGDIATLLAAFHLVPGDDRPVQPRCLDRRRARAARVRTGLAAELKGMTDMSQT